MPVENILFLIIIYGAGLGALAHVGTTLRRAGEAAGGNATRTARRLVIGLWIWAGVASLYATVSGDGIPWLLPALLIPLIGMVGLTFHPVVADILRHSSLPRLVGVQVYRIAGAVFLISFFYFDGEMSREFAVRAGWGDVLTGVLALPVAWIAMRRLPLWPTAVALWCGIGIGDLILAAATAAQFGGPLVEGFPISAIPLLFGPPLGIALHLVALRAMWLQRPTRARALPA